MAARYLWHGSDRPHASFGGEGEADILHVGTLQQASMRCGGKYFHLIEVPDGKSKRIRDKGSDNAATIRRARKSGYTHLVYLNRYEGIDTDELETALERHPNVDFDTLTDREFRQIFPSQKDSLVVLDPGHVKVLGCYHGLKAARRGRQEQILAGGAERRNRPPAAMLSFEEWTGLDNPLVVPESELSLTERAWIDECRDELLDIYQDLDPDAPAIFGLECREVMTSDGVCYMTAPSAMLAIDEGSGKLLGGITNYMIFVEDAARGRGIATNLHICAEEGRWVTLKPSHFSAGGFASRKAAHRKLCERALERGDEVAEVNIERYALCRPEDGQRRLEEGTIEP